MPINVPNSWSTNTYSSTSTTTTDLNYVSTPAIIYTHTWWDEASRVSPSPFQTPDVLLVQQLRQRVAELEAQLAYRERMLLEMARSLSPLPVSEGVRILRRAA